eukprot:scaffold323733_cov31-Tisochrysis_lutea.AAC.3
MTSALSAPNRVAYVSPAEPIPPPSHSMPIVLAESPSRSCSAPIASLAGVVALIHSAVSERNIGRTGKPGSSSGGPSGTCGCGEGGMPAATAGASAIAGGEWRGR